MLSGFACASIAIASGTSSPPPPPPPPVDFSGLPASAAARGPESNGKPHPVLARLLIDGPVAPGQTVRVGVHLTQDEGWHTYWKSPGDIGQPTEAAFALLGGPAQATPLAFPIPQRFEQDGMVSFGYDREVLLSTVLTVPATAPAGPTALSADVNWLVCLTSCIPGSVHLEAPLVVGAAADARPYRALFDHYAAQLPVEPSALKVEYTLSQSAVRPNEPFKAAFVIRPAAGALGALPSTPWPTFTPIAGGYDWGIGSFDVRSGPDGSVVVVVSGDTYEPEGVPTGQTVGGLVQVEVDGKWIRAEVSGPLPWAAAGAAITPVDHPAFAAAAAPAVPAGEKVAIASAAPAPAATGAVGLLGNLLLAFVGGLILNVMPCVLPVLTLKLYGLVEQVDITARQRRATGLAYTGGVVASFLALAGLVLLLRAAFGLDVDWGFQFQYPPYVAALATVVFAFGLSLLGVFEIPVVGAAAADGAANREGLMGSFFTGVFATLLATPCSAPFLGSAIAYAFGAPGPVLLTIFTMVGLGLAAPFLLIAFVPALFRFLPRPGSWMDTLKNVLGFTLIGTTVWLVDVLVAQIGADRAVGFLAFLLAVGVGCWIYGRFGGVAESTGRQLATAGIGALVIGAAGYQFLDLEFADEPVCDDGSLAADLTFGEAIPWQAFSEPRVAALAGKPVFVDFTAEWCLTCKVNERTVLETSSVRGAMQELGVVPLKADWTRRDEVITKWLNQHGRAGVPMYLVIPADRGQAPILLPEVITPSMVVDALKSGT
ncbi:MAG: thioredoxin family protein [Myxococcota bacterium]